MRGKSSREVTVNPRLRYHAEIAGREESRIAPTANGIEPN
jgi:hypothetical protein